MKLTTSQINTLRTSPEGRDILESGGVDLTALDAIFAQLVPDGIDEVYDRISDVLRNDAPVIEHFTGDGGVGPFPIEIRGFGGLFFVEAQEFDPDGVFDSLEDARDCLHFNYDPFIDNYKNLSK